MHSLLLPFIIISILPSPIKSQTNYEPVCPDNFSGYRSGPGCTSYFICAAGVVVSPITECMPGTIFNDLLSVCDFEANFECGSTRVPTRTPTQRPTVSPTPRLEPTTPAPSLPPQTRSPSANVGVENALEYAKKDINNKLFVYQSGWSDWIPSTQYRYDGFLRGLRMMYLEGVGDETFYLGEDISGVEGTKVGLVNIAAFLAQSMKETIKYDACDENNWDVINGVYPLSNACGQLEQSYQDYVCPEGSEHMQCDVDPNMEQRATTQANWYGAPGPLFCGPKSKHPFTGYWDYSHMCDFPWKDPPELCTDYPGQKGGRAVNDEPIKNRNNRTDVEGCCWWGRGVIQTTGICNFGTLNYYLGKRAADEGRPSRYPNIDFCKDPGAVCSRDKHPELKWIAGLFYWVRSLQTYDEGWNYIDNLKGFVRGGMKDKSFIDAVSGIVNRGCHNPPCGTGPLDGGYERQENFQKVLEVLFEPDGSPRVVRDDDVPTYKPTGSSGNNMNNQPSTSTQYITVEEWVDNDEQEEWIDNDEQEEWIDNDEDEDWSEVASAQNDEEEEEDWSESSSTSTMNLYCGETQYDAFDNCGRNGYECPDGYCGRPGLKCFTVGDDCGKEVEKEEAKSPTATPTSKPIAAISVPAIPVDNTGVIAQYCSKSLATIETTCFTAAICEGSEDCPDGTFCWAAQLCGSTEAPSPAPISGAAPFPTYSPTEPWETYTPTQGEGTALEFDVTETFFCGTDRSHASTSCHKRCRGGSNDECDEGETCFGYTACEAERTRAPVSEVATKQPTQKPTLSPTPKENVETEVVNNAVQQLYCASSMAELETSCGIAQSCQEGPCASGQFCFPFTCSSAVDSSATAPVEDPSSVDSQPPPTAQEQQQTQVETQPPAQSTGLHISCPQSSFVGWHTSDDCTEYFDCNKGQMGAVYVCGDGQKYDKVRNICYPEQFVNTFCYGPPLEQEKAPQSSSGGGGGPCSDGRTGWDTASGCREYYFCKLGRVDIIYDCGEDMLFDMSLELCNFASVVQCDDKGKSPALSQPQPPKQSAVSTPSISIPSTPRPTPAPVARNTLRPTISDSPTQTTGNGDEGNGFNWDKYKWSSTETPTSLPRNTTEMPPWLMNEISSLNDAKSILCRTSHSVNNFLVLASLTMQVINYIW